MTINKKVQGAGIGGAVATLVVWVASAAGVDVPAEVGAALATIAAFGAGFLKAE